MNRKQLIVMWVAILVIVGMCLFPPWRFQLIFPDELNAKVISYKSGPYRLVYLGQPKGPADFTDDEMQRLLTYNAELDWTRFLFPLAALVVIAGGLMVTFRERKTSLL